jgi:hypothetical protein
MVDYFYSDDMRPIDYIYLYLTVVVGLFAIWRMKGAWEKFILTQTWQTQMGEAVQPEERKEKVLKGKGKKRRGN